MRGTAPLVISALIALAGCVGGGSPEAAPAAPDSFGDASDAAGPSNTEAGPAGNDTPPAEAVERGPAIRTFSDSFQLSITQAKAQTAQVNLDNNCVNFGKGTVWLVFNGTADLTWTSSTPLDQKLAIDIWDGGGQARLATSGPVTSPANFAFEQFRITQASTLGLAFIVQPVDNAVIAKLPVKLAITFNYIGEPETGAHVIPCYPTPTSLGGDDA